MMTRNVNSEQDQDYVTCELVYTINEEACVVNAGTYILLQSFNLDVRYSKMPKAWEGQNKILAACFFGVPKCPRVWAVFGKNSRGQFRLIRKPAVTQCAPGRYLNMFNEPLYITASSLSISKQIIIENELAQLNMMPVRLCCVSRSKSSIFLINSLKEVQHNFLVTHWIH